MHPYINRWLSSVGVYTVQNRFVVFYYSIENKLRIDNEFSVNCFFSHWITASNRWSPPLVIPRYQGSLNTNKVNVGMWKKFYFLSGNSSGSHIPNILSFKNLSDGFLGWDHSYTTCEDRVCTEKINHSRLPLFYIQTKKLISGLLFIGLKR